MARFSSPSLFSFLMCGALAVCIAPQLAHAQESEAASIFTAQSGPFQSSPIQADPVLITRKVATGVHNAQARAGVIAHAAPSGPKANAATFTATAVGSTSAAVTLTFTFPAAYTVTGEVVLTGGAPNSDFQDLETGTCYTNGYPDSYASGATCTVIVDFAPTKPGLRNGYIALDTSTGVQLYGYVTGVGNASLVTFTPATVPIASIITGYKPFGMAFDGFGDLWVTDITNDVVKEYVSTGGVLSTTPVTFTGFTTPQGIAIDGGGNVYVGDGGAGTLDELAAVNGVVAAGTAPVNFFSSSPFIAGDGPVLVAVNEISGYIYAFGYYATADPNVGFACSTSTGSCSGYEITGTAGLAVGTAGTVFIANGTKIVRYSAALSSAATTVSPTITGADDVAIDAAGNLYVTTTGGSVVQVVAAAGTTSASSTTRTLASSFSAPDGLALDTLGNVYVADTGNTAVKKLDFSDAPGLAFADTALGSQSATQTVTLQNVGNLALTFPIPTTGTNPSIATGFTLSNSSTCPQLTTSATVAGSLAASGTCTYVVAYAPVTAGALTGFLTLTDTNNGATSAKQSIKLTGATSGLSIEVLNATVSLTAGGTTTLTFEVGYGGNTAPTATPTLTVNSSTTGVGAITCQNKLGHNRCSASYNASSLSTGTYTITATQPADSTYSSTSGTGTLTVAP